MRVHVPDKLCVLRTNQAVSCRLQSNQTFKGTRPGHHVPRYTLRLKSADLVSTFGLIAFRPTDGL